MLKSNPVLLPSPNNESSDTTILCPNSSVYCRKLFIVQNESSDTEDHYEDNECMIDVFVNKINFDDTEIISNILDNPEYKSQFDRVQEREQFLNTASMEEKLIEFEKLWPVNNNTPAQDSDSLDVMDNSFSHACLADHNSCSLACRHIDSSLDSGLSVEDDEIVHVLAEHCLDNVDAESLDASLTDSDPVIIGNINIDKVEYKESWIDTQNEMAIDKLLKKFKVMKKGNKMIIKSPKIPFKIKRDCELYFCKEFEREINNGIFDKEGNELSISHVLHPKSVFEPIPNQLLDGHNKFNPERVLWYMKFGEMNGYYTKYIKQLISTCSDNDVKIHAVSPSINAHSLKNNVVKEFLKSQIGDIPISYDTPVCDDVIYNLNLQLNESEAEKIAIVEHDFSIRSYDKIQLDLESEHKTKDISRNLKIHDGQELENRQNNFLDTLKFNPAQFSSNKPTFNVMNISDKQDNLTNKITRLSKQLEQKYDDHELICGNYGIIDVKTNDFNTESVIHAIDHDNPNHNTLGREFYRNLLAINVSISSHMISAEIDTGSPYCIIGLKTISRIDRDWETKFKRTKFDTPLKGVTGKQLEIIGAYNIPIKFPIIGLKTVNVKVITDQDLFLIGRDFLTNNHITISFAPTKYTVKFGRSITSLTIDQQKLVNFNDGLAKVSIDVSNQELLPGTYLVSLTDNLDDNCIQVQMPEQIVNIDKSCKCIVNLIAYKHCNETSLMNLTLNLVRHNEKDEHLSDGQDLKLTDLNSGFHYVPCHYDTIDEVPEDVEYLFDHRNEDFFPKPIQEKFSHLTKTKDGVNTNICVYCITEPRFATLTIPELAEIHKTHLQKEVTFGSDQCKKIIDTIIDKLKREKENNTVNKINISQESEDINFNQNDEDKDFSHLTKPNNLDLIPGEIGIPRFKSKELIKETVNNKIKDLPVKVQEILREPLLRNEAMSSCPWDIPPVKGEALHYECKEIPKQTRVYPVRKEDLKCLYSTIQFLLFYRIIDRAPVNASYGSPTFLIRRKPTDTESSRSPRLLLDARAINNQILGTKSASMTSCYDNLRNMASGTKYLSTVDLSNMFYSLKNSQEVVDSGAVNFTTVYGVFRLLRSIQGGALSPAFANTVIMKRLHLDSQGIPSYLNEIMSFYDDINLCSKDSYTIIDHALDLADLLNRINSIGFMINMEKSTFCVDLTKRSIEILGLTVSRNKIAVTEKRRQDIISQLVKPKNKTHLQRLIGLLNYLRNLMTADSLKDLNVLSSKLKNSKLTWDTEGDEALMRLKTTLESTNLLINVPDCHHVPLLFSDASVSCAAGILFYLKIDDIEDPDMTYPDIKPSEMLSDYNKKFNIATTPLTEITKNIFDFICNVFYHYHPSDNKRNSHVISLVINSLIILTPQLIHKITFMNLNDVQKNYKEFLQEIECQKIDLDKHPAGLELLLNGLSHVLQRQIIMILICKDHENNRPFIKITSDTNLSPVLICFENNQFQLLALMRNEAGYPKYSTKTIEDLSSNEILKLYKKAEKENTIKFGGVFSFSLPESYRACAIYLKELLALSSSLSYWSGYLKMTKAFIFIDSSTVLHGLKNVKSKGLGKLHRIGISLSHGFPLAQVFLVSSKINPADFYSRIESGEIKDEIIDQKNMSMLDFVNSYVNVAITDDSELTEQGLDDNCAENNTVHIIGEENIMQFLDPPPNHDTILKTHQLYYKDLIYTKNSKYIYENGYILDKENKIFLPKELWTSFILLNHASNHHPGIERMMQIMLATFCVNSKSDLRSAITTILKACIACGEAKSSFFKGYAYESSYGGEIMNSISIDIIESTKYFAPQADLPIHSCLGFIDNVSKYAEIAYLATGNSNAVVNALLSFFSRHRIPRYLYADNGSTLRSQKVYKLCNLLGIQFVRSSPFASKTRGLIENLFKQLRNASRIFCSYYEGINELLAFLYFIRIYNNLPLPISNVTVTPGFLAHFPYSRALCKKDYSSAISNNYSKRLVSLDKKTMQQEHLNMEQLYATAVRCIKDQVKLHNDRVNKNRVKHNFSIGDIVLARNFARTRKNHPIYNRDLMRIIEVNNSMVVLQSVVTGLTAQRHILHIKRIKILDDSSINDMVQQKFGLFTKKYIENLIEQYKKEESKPDKEITRDMILTRSRAKQRNADIEESVQIDEEIETEEFDVTFGE